MPRLVILALALALAACVKVSTTGPSCTTSGTIKTGETTGQSGCAGGTTTVEQQASGG